MTGKIQTRLAVLAALAAITAVLVPSGLASGSPNPEPSDLPNVGVLQLHLGAVDHFVYQVWNGSQYVPSTEDPQPIGPPNKCELKNAVAVDGPLATITSVDGHNVGMSGDDLGMRDTGSRGTPCGQVDLSEGALSIALDPSGPLAGLEMDYAEIDIEGKHDVEVSIEAFLGGASVGGPHIAFECTDSDCGPDSAAGDNVRVIVGVDGHSDAGADVVVSGVFDRLDITVTSTGGGEFSLNGGSDGTAPGPLGQFLGVNDSLFHITDVEVLECGQEATLGEVGVFGGTYLLTNCTGSKAVVFETDPVTNTITITRLGPPLSGAPYSLESWTFTPVPEVPSPVLLYNDGTPLDREARFCLSDPREDASPPSYAGLDPSDYLPGDHTTCVIEDTRTTLGQFDFGSGEETGLRGDFILFSIGDASRSFR